MKQFFILSDKRLSGLTTGLDHYDCLGLMAHAPAHILTKDLEAWRDIAQSGDVFEINHNKHVLCLDLELIIKNNRTCTI